MFTAKLEVLGINAPIGFRNYHDDGFVDSIEEYTLRLAKKYKNMDYLRKRKERVVGRCFPSKWNVHIFYEEYGTEEDMLILRAHEETHALDNFGRLDLLERKILLEQGVKIDFEDITKGERTIEDMEVIAEIGAVYMVNKKRFNPDNFAKWRDFDIARGIYEEHKIK